MKMRGHPVQICIIVGALLLLPFGLFANSALSDSVTGIFSHKMIQRWAENLQSHVVGAIERNLMIVTQFIRDESHSSLIIDQQGNQLHAALPFDGRQDIQLADGVTLTMDASGLAEQHEVKYFFHGASPFRGAVLKFKQAANATQWWCTLTLDPSSTFELGDTTLTRQLAQQILTKTGGRLSQCVVQ